MHDARSNAAEIGPKSKQQCCIFAPYLQLPHQIRPLWNGSSKAYPLVQTSLRLQVTGGGSEGGVVASFVPHNAQHLNWGVGAEFNPGRSVYVPGRPPRSMASPCLCYLFSKVCLLVAVLMALPHSCLALCQFAGTYPIGARHDLANSKKRRTVAKPSKFARYYLMWGYPS